LKPERESRKSGLHSHARFVKDESGATAIEYALIAAGISVAIILTVNALGGTLNGIFQNVNTQLGGK
jgi:pilus assembly protein Flp/PilA